MPSAPSNHSTQLTHLAFLHAKPGQGDELGRRLHDLYEASRAEAGNINYDVHRSLDDPLVWMVYENWRSPADLDLHFTLPYMESFAASLGEVLDGEMDLRRFTMTTPFIAPKL